MVRRGTLPHLVLRVTRADEQQLQCPQVSQPLAWGAHYLIQEGLAELGEHTAVVEHPGEERQQVRGMDMRSPSPARRGWGCAGNMLLSFSSGQETPKVLLQLSVSSWETKRGTWLCSELGENTQFQSANVTKFSHHPLQLRRLLQIHSMGQRDT